jgi:ferredoxin
MYALTQRAQAQGLAVRGALHLQAGEFEGLAPAFQVRTLVLLGFTGGDQWEHFERSAEAADGMPDPLDRWSRRVIGLLAREFLAQDFYPNGSTPQLPFQRLAARCEPVHPSPIGLLIHERWGLWHAYRGALGLRETLVLPAQSPPPNTCTSCAAKPCLSGCPVNAFDGGGFDVKVCVGHVGTTVGTECRERGCLARRACPVGADHRYSVRQQRFHMQAFLRATQSVR